MAVKEPKRQQTILLLDRNREIASVKTRISVTDWLESFHDVRYELFRGITQRRMIILYRRFGTTCRSHLQGYWTSWLLKMGPIRCSETSVKGYYSTLRNAPEECISRQHRGGSRKSQISLCSLHSCARSRRKVRHAVRSEQLRILSA
jgi:hypothetical protein